MLSKEEQHILINNLPFNPIGVLIRTALGTGARLGELLGLSWKDIDFENNIIHIRNGVIRENVFTADGKKVETYQIVLGPLKTHKSKRDRLCQNSFKMTIKIGCNNCKHWVLLI